MKTRSSIIAALAIIALAAGCSASSQSGPGEPLGGADDEQTGAVGAGLAAKGGRMFAQADKDSDGKVTLAEANQASAAKFATADANHDGYLDATELEALKPGRGGPGRGQAGPAKHDANGDGKLTKDEAPPPIQEHFDELDTNKDGALDRQELQAAHAKRGGPGGHGMVARLDKNGDGKIAKDEAPPPMQEHFDEIDANKDGFVEQAELQAAHARRQGQGGPGQRMAHLDTNKDGKVSQAEFTATVQTWFSRLDANKDGAVTREETHAKRPHPRAK